MKWAIVWGAAILFSASDGRADGVRTSSLGWARLPGAESCIPARDLARAVEKKLGRSVFVSTSEAELTIEGRVERVLPRGWRATLVATRADGVMVGRRELRAPGESCSSLDESVVLVIALMIDPTATGAPAEAPPEAPPPTRTVIVVVPAPAPRWRGDVAVEGEALAFGTGALVPALRLTTSVTPPGFLPIELEGDLSALAHTADNALRLRLAYGGIALCPSLVPFASSGDKDTPVRLSACVGVDVGVIHAAPGALSAASERDDAFVSGTLRARLAVPLVDGPMWALDVRLEAGLLAFFQRPSYSYESLDAGALGVVQNQIFRLPALGGMGAAGFGIELR